MKNFIFNKEVSLQDIEAILDDKEIFGLSLIEAGLGDHIVKYLNQMNKVSGIRNMLREI